MPKTCKICPYPVFSDGHCIRHYHLTPKGQAAIKKRNTRPQVKRSTPKGIPLPPKPRKPPTGQKKGKKTGFQLAVHEADKWFSRYVRLLFMREGGVVQCVTHRETGFFTVKSIQCGHYQLRQHYATRWTLENCAPQCSYCNKWKQGEQVKMGEWLDRHYGQGTADRMRVKAAIGRKVNEFEVRQIAGYWKLEFDKLAAEKGNPWRK